MMITRLIPVYLSLVFGLLLSDASHSQSAGDTSVTYLLNEAAHYKDVDPDYAFKMAQRAKELSLDPYDPNLLTQSELLLSELFFNQAAYNHAMSHLLASMKGTGRTKTKPKAAGPGAQSIGKNLSPFRSPGKSTAQPSKSISDI